MVDVAERTWRPDEAARAEVVRLYDESCADSAPLTAAQIARELPGLKVRWTQRVIAKRRRDAKRAAAAEEAVEETVPVAEEAAPELDRAQYARPDDASAPQEEEHEAGRGIVVARGVFVLGLAVSIAANIGHVVIVTRPEEVIVLWAAIGMAALWPVILAASVEVVSRVAWPAGWRWWLPGYVGTVLVGLIAFTISYQHLHGLLIAFGESLLTALIGPIGLDLTIVVAGAALLAIGKSLRTATTAPIGATA